VRDARSGGLLQRHCGWDRVVAPSLRTGTVTVLDRNARVRAFGRSHARPTTPASSLAPKEAVMKHALERSPHSWRLRSARRPGAGANGSLYSPGLALRVGGRRRIERRATSRSARRSGQLSLPSGRMTVTSSARGRCAVSTESRSSHTTDDGRPRATVVRLSWPRMALSSAEPGRRRSPRCARRPRALSPRQA
jgi:hypothetical protein